MDNIKAQINEWRHFVHNKRSKRNGMHTDIIQTLREADVESVLKSLVHNLTAVIDSILK